MTPSAIRCPRIALGHSAHDCVKLKPNSALRTWRCADEATQRSSGRDTGGGFGDVLRRTKRDTDAVGRFGGEEFIVVCEETDAKGAEFLAERNRTELETTTRRQARVGTTVSAAAPRSRSPQKPNPTS
jgi:hypothetical protein